MNAQPFSTDIDLLQNRIFNAAFQQSSVPPIAPIVGEFYTDNTGVVLYWSGSEWVAINSASNFSADLAAQLPAAIPLAGGVLKFVATGLATSGTAPLSVAHNLNTNSVSVTVWSASTAGTIVPIGAVLTAVTNVDANHITITTASTQTGLMVVVVG